METDHRGDYQPPEEQPEQGPEREYTPPYSGQEEILRGEGEQVAAEQPLSFTPETLVYLEERKRELAPTIADRGNHLTYYYLDTQQRIMEEVVRHGRYVTPDLIAHHLAVSLYHANTWEHHDAYRAIDTVRWGFFAAAAPHDPTLFQDEGRLYKTVGAYNDLQQTAMEQTGQPVQGVTLDAEQSQLLAWLLDQVAISHDSGGRESFIPFAPLEQVLREATEAEAIKHSERHFFRSDHKERADTRSLMEQWQQQEDQES